jgi:hypothetical protein
MTSSCLPQNVHSHSKIILNILHGKQDLYEDNKQYSMTKKKEMKKRRIRRNKREILSCISYRTVLHSITYIYTVAFITRVILAMSLIFLLR